MFGFKINKEVTKVCLIVLISLGVMIAGNWVDLGEKSTATQASALSSTTTLRLRGENDQSPPVKIKVEVDGKNAGIIQFDNGDNSLSWERLSLGHVRDSFTLRLTYLNGFFEGSEDKYGDKYERVARLDKLNVCDTTIQAEDYDRDGTDEDVPSFKEGVDRTGPYKNFVNGYGKDVLIEMADETDWVEYEVRCSEEEEECLPDLVPEFLMCHKDAEAECEEWEMECVEYVYEDGELVCEEWERECKEWSNTCTVIVEYAIHNRGCARAGASNASITANNVTQIRPTPGLNPGGTHNGQVKFNINCGPTSITICADVNNIVMESNEGNNCVNATC